MKDYNILGARLGKAVNRRPYTGYYIRYVMCGEQPFTKPLYDAVVKLIHELTAEPPHNRTKTVKVKVPLGVDVPEGALILAEARTCICGVTFIPRIWNQINHSRACARLRAKIERNK